MGTMYLPVFKAGENEFVITSYEAVFKTHESAEENAETLLMLEDIKAPAEFVGVMVVEPDEGVEGVEGNFFFLNVMYTSG